jgi:hypothetical protein
MTGRFQPRWLLAATLAAVLVGIAVAVWLFGALGGG